jgi:hypothetical protein
VLITVGATILALFPLAVEGRLLWKPLCYAQIGGFGVATFITLLFVPVFYSIAVLDLKIVKWEAVKLDEHSSTGSPSAQTQVGELVLLRECSVCWHR